MTSHAGGGRLDKGAEPDPRARAVSQQETVGAGQTVEGAGIGSGPVGPAMLLALQRQAGNRAVQRLVSEPTVQRQDEPARPPIGFAVRVASGDGRPSISGATHAEPSGAKVRVTAPDTSFNPTTVEIPQGTKVGDGHSIQAGVMQTMMGSVRDAEYRSPGAPPGGAPTVRHAALGQSRDALASGTEEGKVIARPGANAPFYEPPVMLSDMNPTEEIHFSEARTANLMDRPGWSADATIGSGEFAPRLVGTRGADTFLTSIAAKYSDAPGLVHLNQVSWNVPWDMAIDDMGAGTGGQGKVANSDIPPPETPGDIAAVKAAAGGVKSWIEFPTLGDAMMCSAGVLLSNLPLVKDNDPTSFGFTLDALMAKNPRFTGAVTVNKKFRGVGQEELSLTVRGASASYQPDVAHLDEGGAMSFAFNLATVFTRDTLATAGSIDFTVSVVPVVGTAQSQTATMAFPYLPLSTTMVIGSGEYAIQAGCRG